MEQINDVTPTTEDIKQTIASNLSGYRKKAGLTQQQLADKLNYSDKAVSKWERAEAIPDVIVLKSIADIYGVKVDDFFSVQVADKEVTSKTADKVLVLNHSHVAMFGTVPEVYSRTDELEEMGLTVPQITKIFRALHDRGFDVSPSVFTVSQGADELMRYFEGRGTV